MNNLQIRKRVTKELTRVKAKKGIFSFVSGPQDYKIVNEEIMRYLTNKSRLSGLYVALSSPYTQISKELEAKKIHTENIVFIDGVTGKKSKTDSCVTLKNRNSLTELSLVMSQACKNKAIKFIFLDSVSTLLIYNNLEITERFMNFFINKIKNLDLLMIMISIEEDKSNKLMPVLAQFCDRSVKI